MEATSAQPQNRQTPQPSQEQSAPQLSTREQAARSLFEQAVETERKNGNAAIAGYEQITQRYGWPSDPSPVRALAARALLNKGAILNEQGDTKAAILAYDQIGRRFGQDKAPVVREILASALISKAEAFHKLGQTHRTLNIYDQLNQQFGKDKGSYINRLVDVAKWRADEIRIQTQNVTLSPKP